MHEKLEQLSRRLLSGCTELTEPAVRQLIVNEVVSPMATLGIEQFSVALIPGEGSPIFFHTGKAFFTTTLLKDFTATARHHQILHFSLDDGEVTVRGYSENWSDWCVIAANCEDKASIDVVLEGLWYQFFE